MTASHERGDEAGGDAPPEPVIFELDQLETSGEHPVMLEPDGVSRILTKMEGPVPLSVREGVFRHRFQCHVCDLEFVLFSWLRDRHRVRNTYCPECGQITPKSHYLEVISEIREFGVGPEIYELSVTPGSVMLDDSEMVPDYRLTEL
jgi:hypothetical protein